MDIFFEYIASINAVINDFVWVKIGLITLIGSGIFLTVKTHFFQLTHLSLWLKTTIGSIFAKGDNDQKTSPISQFQSLCTALAATIGIGNIAGVSAAIVMGGPGSIFWMWIAAFLAW